MANKPINMKHLRAVLQLHIKGHNKRSIAKSSGLSRNTIKKYFSLYLSLGKDIARKIDLYIERMKSRKYIETNISNKGDKIFQIIAKLLRCDK